MKFEFEEVFLIDDRNNLTDFGSDNKREMELFFKRAEKGVSDWYVEDIRMGLVLVCPRNSR